MLFHYFKRILLNLMLIGIIDWRIVVFVFRYSIPLYIYIKFTKLKKR